MRIWIRVFACGLVLAVVALGAGPAAARTRTSRFQTLPLAMVHELVQHYAAKYGIPLHIARNLIAVESGWRQTAVSRRSARGLMQIRPATARGLRVNPYDTRQNIEGGMRYLRSLYNRFKRWDLALAGYHSGPNKVVRAGGIPRKSRAYVKRILAGADPVTGARPKPQAAAKQPPVVTPRSVAVVETRIPFSGTRRRLVASTGEARLTTVETVLSDVVANRTDELVLVEGTETIRVIRTFQLVGGILTLVSEHTEGATTDDVEPERGGSESP